MHYRAYKVFDYNRRTSVPLIARLMPALAAQGSAAA